MHAYDEFFLKHQTDLQMIYKSHPLLCSPPRVSYQVVAAGETHIEQDLLDLDEVLEASASESEEPVTPMSARTRSHEMKVTHMYRMTHTHPYLLGTGAQA